MLCMSVCRCDKFTGNCECAPGWEGQNCEFPCVGSNFGLNCRNSCDCHNGAYCNPVDGTCICAGGYYGTK